MPGRACEHGALVWCDNEKTWTGRADDGYLGIEPVDGKADAIAVAQVWIASGTLSHSRTSGGWCGLYRLRYDVSVDDREPIHTAQVRSALEIVFDTAQLAEAIPDRREQTRRVAWLNDRAGCSSPRCLTVPRQGLPA
jgi:hypothetical protein